MYLRFIAYSKVVLYTMLNVLNHDVLAVKYSEKKKFCNLIQSHVW